MKANSRSIGNGFLASLIMMCSLNANAYGLNTGFELPVSKTELKVASYNVENLFDTEDDSNKDDATFLPVNHSGKKGCENESTPDFKKICYKLDWTEKRLEMKFYQIRKALLAQGPLPDALVLVEMENLNVAKMLAKYLGFNDVRASEGPDRRGIDVVIMWRTSKLRYVKHAQMEVPNAKTRPILKVMFEVRAQNSERVGSHLVLYANHWPAQMGNTNPKRIAAAKVLAASIEADSKMLGDTYHAVAMGDFNVTPEDNPNAIDDIILSKRWDKHLVDVHALSDDSNNPMKRKMPPGTHFFPKDGWRRFDKILVSQSLVNGSGFEVKPETLRVVAADYLLTSVGGNRVPHRYDFFAERPEEAGYSDHLPIVVKLDLPN